MLSACEAQQGVEADRRSGCASCEASGEKVARDRVRREECKAYDLHLKSTLLIV